MAAAGALAGLTPAWGPPSGVRRGSTPSCRRSRPSSRARATTAARADTASTSGSIHLVDEEAELEHLWVDPPAIGHGVGSRLLAAFVEEARRLGVSRIVLNSDPYAEEFYRRRGAVRIGDHAVAEIPGRVLPRMAISLDGG